MSKTLPFVKHRVTCISTHERGDHRATAKERKSQHSEAEHQENGENGHFFSALFYSCRDLHINDPNFSKVVPTCQQWISVTQVDLDALCNVLLDVKQEAASALKDHRLNSDLCISELQQCYTTTKYLLLLLLPPAPSELWVIFLTPKTKFEPFNTRIRTTPQAPTLIIWENLVIKKGRALL